MPVARRLVVHLGPAIEESIDGLEVARASGGHQGHFAARSRQVGIGAGLEQQRDHRRPAVAAREQQRGDAEIVGGIDAGAGPEEERRHLDVVPMRRPVQRGGAIGLRHVDVGAGGDKSPNRSPILPSREVDETISLRRHGARQTDAQNQCNSGPEGLAPRTPTRSLGAALPARSVRVACSRAACDASQLVSQIASSHRGRIRSRNAWRGRYHIAPWEGTSSSWRWPQRCR